MYSSLYNKVRKTNLYSFFFTNSRRSIRGVSKAILKVKAKLRKKIIVMTKV